MTPSLIGRDDCSFFFDERYSLTFPLPGQSSESPFGAPFDAPFGSPWDASLSSLLGNPGLNAWVNPLEVSRWMLFSMGIDIRLHPSHRARLPRSPFLMISNHRSFLDAPVLMAAAARPVHFACHHYMAQVPIMRNVVDALGCFPLDAPSQRGRTFFKQATGFLKSDASIGIFPEGTGPMVTMTQADEVGPFHRGFAHLALRASLPPSSSTGRCLTEPSSEPSADSQTDHSAEQPAVQPDLKIVPAAIISLEENRQDMVPFKVFSWFDPTEPLFQQAGRHPAVIYRRVAVVIGEPIDVRDFRGQGYHGKRAGQVASELSNLCHDKIQTLLKEGCY